MGPVSHHQISQTHLFRCLLLLGVTCVSMLHSVAMVTYSNCVASRSSEANALLIQPRLKLQLVKRCKRALALQQHFPTVIQGSILLVALQPPHVFPLFYEHGYAV